MASANFYDTFTDKRNPMINASFSLSEAFKPKVNILFDERESRTSGRND